MTLAPSLTVRVAIILPGERMSLVETTSGGSTLVGVLRISGCQRASVSHHYAPEVPSERFEEQTAGRRRSMLDHRDVWFSRSQDID